MGLEEQFITTFDAYDEEDRTNRWEEWLSRLDCSFSVKTIKEDNQRLQFLKFFGDSGVDKIYRSLKEETDTYEVAKTKLTSHFASQFNTKVFALKFRDVYQYPGETFDDFVNRLKEKAKKCAFSNQEEEIVTQILHRCTCEKVKPDSKNPIKLEQLIAAGKLEDAVKEQLQECKKFIDMNEKSDKVEVNQVNNRTYYQATSYGQTTDKMWQKKHTNSNECPAADKQCWVCGKSGHFAQLWKQRDGNGNRAEHRSGISRGAGHQGGNGNARYGGGSSNGTGRAGSNRGGGYGRGGGQVEISL
ncbi:Transposon Tf2-9 poly [Brachionus plicatilis]|uniref:Transposon Tf2-9 poly n=1 Tax=Brachionus plicatilis TaxID=10195 RepID=A0A3M7Q1P9_BRAPC|nr:Transposon Tf2-9 poly [Brachionus plicatilis]